MLFLFRLNEKEVKRLKIRVFMQNKRKQLIYLTAISLISVSFFICFLIFNFSFKQATAKEEPQSKTIITATTAPFIPTELEFAGESVPVDIYWVYEGLDKELIISTYQHSLTLLSLKRSARFFPIIEKILAEEAIPEDFKYLCVAESNLQNVISPAKATGYWQFMETTGRRYGLEINDEIDERYDLEKSTRAACQFLKDLKKKFGSWSLCAAAYNMGETGLQKNLDRQRCNNYWDLLLNAETARYVYRILSYKLIFERPYQYNFSLKNDDIYYPIPYKEITITEPIPDLYQFAAEQNITYRELKELNPWLRSSTLLKVKTKSYQIKVPQKSKNKRTDL